MKKLLLSAIVVGFAFTGIAQNQDVPQNGLVGFYKLEGNGADSSGNAYDGVNTATPAVPDHLGQAGKACYFNGISSKIVVPTNAGFQPNNTISIAAWIKPDSNANAATILSKRFSLTADPYHSYELAYNPSTNRWIFGVSKGISGTLKVLPAKMARPTGSWMFIAGTFDGSIMKLYLDGDLDTSLAYSGNLGYGAVSLYIGYSGSGTDYFKGNMDDITIYNRVLTASEIAAMHNGTVGIASAQINKQHIGLYPNPANNELIIDHEGVTYDHVVILDMAGKRVMESTTADHLNINELSKGVYLLNLLNHGEAVSGTLKFVKN